MRSSKGENNWESFAFDKTVLTTGSFFRPLKLAVDFVGLIFFAARVFLVACFARDLLESFKLFVDLETVFDFGFAFFVEVELFLTFFASTLDLEEVFDLADVTRPLSDAFFFPVTFFEIFALDPLLVFFLVATSFHLLLEIFAIQYVPLRASFLYTPF